MLDQEAHKVPRDVDSPIPIMFWDPVEFVISVSIFGFGILMNLWLLGMVGAIFVLVASQKLKRGAKRGTVQHYLWRSGLQVDAPLRKKFPQPWDTEFID